MRTYKKELEIIASDILEQNASENGAVELKQAISILKTHNEWRRFNGDVFESPEMTNPILLGKSIDIIIKYFERVK